jgi:hypothetical protein
MQALGLSFEWRFSCCSVLDRSVAPCWPPERPAEHDWHAVRRVRNALLALMKEYPASRGRPANKVSSIEETLS